MKCSLLGAEHGENGSVGRERGNNACDGGPAVTGVHTGDLQKKFQLVENIADMRKGERSSERQCQFPQMLINIKTYRRHRLGGY